MQTLAEAGHTAVAETANVLGQLTSGAEKIEQPNGVTLEASAVGMMFGTFSTENGFVIKSACVNARGHGIGALCFWGRGTGLAAIPTAAAEQYAARFAKIVLDRAEPPAMSWDCEQVGAWLVTVALEQYAESFRGNGVDGPTLLNDVNEEEAKTDLGLKGLHAKKLLREINKLRAGPFK